MIRGRLIDGAGAGIPDGVLEWWHPGRRRFSDPRPKMAEFLIETSEAPHFAVRVLGRGIQTQYLTRLYFADDPDAATDPVLKLVPEHRRHTLLAQPTSAGEYRSMLWCRARTRQYSSTFDGPSAIGTTCRPCSTSRSPWRPQRPTQESSPHRACRYSRRRESRWLRAAALEGDAALSGNIVIPLVRKLTEAVAARNPESARYVHRGATSQDIIDTARSCASCGKRGTARESLTGIMSACAALAREHAVTPMPGRTWLQHASPTTFGLKAAGWLDMIGRCRVRIRDAAERSQVLQLGGASGTLASLGDGVPPSLRRWRKSGSRCR